MASKLTVAQLAEETRQAQAAMDARLDTLTTLVHTIVKAVSDEQREKEAKKAEKPAKQEKPWISDCPDYATAAQRVEYEKLAKRAAEQRQAVMDALGTKSVKCFIPVSPDNPSRMPHTVRWTASYSK